MNSESEVTQGSGGIPRNEDRAISHNDKVGLLIALIEAGEYLLTAIGFSDDRRAAVYVESDFIELKVTASTYDEAKELAIATADEIKRRDPLELAESWARYILSECEKQAGKSVVVTLTEYESQSDMDFLIGKKHALPVVYSRVLNAEVEFLLSEEQLQVVTHRLNMSDYFDWLAKESLPNTSANRARYCGLAAVRGIVTEDN